MPEQNGKPDSFSLLEFLIGSGDGTLEFRKRAMHLDCSFYSQREGAERARLYGSSLQCRAQI
jgi:hypothetical protein